MTGGGANGAGVPALRPVGAHRLAAAARSTPKAHPNVELEVSTCDAARTARARFSRLATEPAEQPIRATIWALVRPCSLSTSMRASRCSSRALSRVDPRMSSR